MGWKPKNKRKAAIIQTTAAMVLIAGVGGIMWLQQPPAKIDADADKTEAAAAAVPPQPIPRVRIYEREGYRYIRTNGIPDHETGEFPNRNNPNKISRQRYRFRTPLNPQPAASPVTLRDHLPGVAINGVPFDPGTAELWQNNPEWRYEAFTGPMDLGLDDNNAHVQPNGAYHYHGLPVGLIQNLTLNPDYEMTLVGYAADGYPIYTQVGYADPNDPESDVRKMRSSYQLKAGQRPAPPNGPGGDYDGAFTQDYHYVAGSGDLDQCNGRFAVTPEYPQGIYHYYITEDFPYIPRILHGQPDDSFAKHQLGGPPRHRHPHPHNPPPNRPR